jgi:DNA-binding NarL/FixJ family response regulator
MQSFQILVVEDHEAFRRFIRLALQQKVGFQIVGEVSDGLDAVQKAEELQPNLVLLDIGLPKLNGLEAGRRVRKVSPNSKILFLTQESSCDIVEEALSIGAHGYVLKVRCQSDLLPAIDAVVSGKRFVSSGLDFKEPSNADLLHRHEILFCSNEGVLLDSLMQFIAAALQAGDAAIVWVTESHRQALLQRLCGQGVDIDSAIQIGTFIASDVGEKPDPVRMLEAVRSLIRAASKAGKEGPRVALCGERAGRLWAEGKIDAAIQLEQLCNELAKSHPIDILCPYPLPNGQRNDQALKSLCAEHTAVHSA